MTFEVHFIPEFSEEFRSLQTRAEKGNGEARYLLKLVEKAIAKLVLNPRRGIKVPHKLWPREYVAKYGVNNLWKLNLDSYWRMIYTLAGNEAKLVSLIIEVMDHKAYDRKFGYRTS